MELQQSQSLILASSSPRRRELLDQIGVRYQVQPADIDETPRFAEPPYDYVLRMACEKAQAVANYCQVAAVLAADTSVVCNNRILGKPNSSAEAAQMLQLLSGQRHQVLTAICLIAGSQVLGGPTSTNQISEIGASHTQTSKVVTTHVQFRHLTEAEIEQYIATGEPMDKAGSYGIQGRGAVLVEGIQGSYSNVVGLPLTETSALLLNAGIDIWQN